MYIRRSPRCMQCIFQLIFAHICASIRIYGDILLMVTYSYGDILVWWHTRMLTYSSSDLVLCDNILVMVTHSYRHTCAQPKCAYIWRHTCRLPYAGAVQQKSSLWDLRRRSGPLGSCGQRYQLAVQMTSSMLNLFKAVRLSKPKLSRPRERLKEHRSSRIIIKASLWTARQDPKK